MIRESIIQKSYLKAYHANVNVNLIAESVIQIRSGITINVNARAKNIIYVKKIIFKIMLHVVPKMINN